MDGIFESTRTLSRSDQVICEFCDRSVPIGAAIRARKVPLRRGGMDECATCCVYCKKRRGLLTLEEFQRVHRSPYRLHVARSVARFLVQPHAAVRNALKLADWAQEMHDPDLIDSIDRHINGFNNTCVYCGCSLNRKNRSHDHMIPLSRGGSYGVVNRCQSCIDCNTTKGSLTAEEFRHYRSDPVWLPRMRTVALCMGNPRHAVEMAYKLAGWAEERRAA